jgi:predicted RNA-binding Zn ribbon-like protein
VEPIRPLARLEALVNAAPSAQQVDQAAADHLVTVLRQYGETLDHLELSDAVEVCQALDRLRELLLIDDVDRAARRINLIFDQVAARPRLSQHDHSAWHIHVDPEDSGWGTWLLASSALALAGLIQEHGRRTWGQCEATGCARYYIGDGRGGERRYCSARCASRSRVARHRSRRGATR